MTGRRIEGYHRLSMAITMRCRQNQPTRPCICSGIFEELILPDQMDEQRYEQHKERTEKTLKKVVIFAAAIFIVIVVGAFFV